MTAAAVPARAVLAAAEAETARRGHENHGFLSERHGLVPTLAPATAFPASHRAWDEFASELPPLHRTLGLRRAARALPALDAGPDALPDALLLRAATFLGIATHAYWHAESEPPDALPDCLRRPWEQVSARLGRAEPVLSYVDLIVHNWRLVDPAAPDPMRVENMRLLVPTVDNAEERVFYLTQAEILAQCAPVVGAVVRAQEAAARGDVGALSAELAAVADRLREVALVSFSKIDPNPWAPTHVDPVTWVRTVADLAVPLRAGAQGPSGTSSPIFHVLDVFFGRRAYETFLGREAVHLRAWYPPAWRDFLEAVSRVSVRGFVERAGDRALAGHWDDALQAYAGDHGFLARHRLKVFGYLELAFKLGRTLTIGGFSGVFFDRTWHKVDDELDAARRERHAPGGAGGCPAARVLPAADDAPPARAAAEVALDTAGTGVRVRAGDRCQVLPAQSDELVARTLRALRARGDEPVRLTARWREFAALRTETRGAVELPLRDVLRYGRIRPVERSVAKLLLALTHDERLHRIVEARAEDQWELWDLLELLAERGFNPRALWRAHPGEREHVCRVVPPERFRTYSAASAMEDPGAAGADRVRLLVGPLRYRPDAGPLARPDERRGTASTFLADAALRGAEAVPLRVVRPPRFRPPADPAVPIVMLAGGTGLAPFLGFLEERLRQPGAGETWLFVGARTRDEVHAPAALARAAAGGVRVRVALSREDAEARVTAAGLAFAPGARRRVGDLLLAEPDAGALADLLRAAADGGRGAHVYVCGRTGFAGAAAEALLEVLRRAGAGGAEDPDAAARRAYRRMVGEGRLAQEIFTTYAGPHADARRAFDASDLATRNDDARGHWLAISGRLYDVGELLHVHPGGAAILRSYAGTDATAAYRRVLHHVNPEVDAMLGLYELGVMRRLDFGAAWGVAVREGGVRYASLAELFRTWVRQLYLAAEMQNAYRLARDVADKRATRDEPATSRSALKLRLLLEAHRQFRGAYLGGICGAPADELWRLTSGLAGAREDVRWMRAAIERARAGDDARRADAAADGCARALSALVERAAPEDDPAARALAERVARLGAADASLLAALKAALGDGVRVFETLERDAARAGGEALLAAARAIPAAVAAYQGRVAAADAAAAGA